MEKLPNLQELSSEAKDVLIEELWQKVQELQRQLEGKEKAPKKTTKNSSVPPSKGFKANVKPMPAEGVKRQASVGRAGGGRKLHPEPNQTIVATLKRGPVCAGELLAEQQRLEAR